jgi:hypothetical protein
MDQDPQSPVFVSANSSLTTPRPLSVGSIGKITAAVFKYGAQIDDQPRFTLRKFRKFYTFTTKDLGGDDDPAVREMALVMGHPYATNN